MHPELVFEDDLPPAPVELTASAAMLRAGFALSELDLTDLHFGYLSVGGAMSLGEVGAVLRGEREVPALEHDYLAQALNDYFTTRGPNHPVAYAEELEKPGYRPDEGLARPTGVTPGQGTWLHAPMGPEEITSPTPETSYQDLLLQAVNKDAAAAVVVVAGLSWSVTDEHELLEFLQRTVTSPPPSSVPPTVPGSPPTSGVPRSPP